MKAETVAQMAGNGWWSDGLLVQIGVMCLFLLILLLTKHFSPKSSHDAEIEHWRKQYEELFSKVKPFQVSRLLPTRFVEF